MIEHPTMSEIERGLSTAATLCGCETISSSSPNSDATEWSGGKDLSLPRNWPAWRKIYDTGVSCVLFEYITTLISNTGASETSSEEFYLIHY
jgi:hypothetical protein